jgi:DNA polymerase III epsilon subunit-like protein
MELINRSPLLMSYVRNATYRPDAVAVHGLTAEFLADNPLFDHVASKGHLMTASNQIFLVVDAGTRSPPSRRLTS